MAVFFSIPISISVASKNSASQMEPTEEREREKLVQLVTESKNTSTNTRHEVAENEMEHNETKQDDDILVSPYSKRQTSSPTFRHSIAHSI